jgi:hypothetical protein
MAMSELKQRLLKIELTKLGFPDAKYVRYSDMESGIEVNPHDQHLIRIMDGGAISYYGEHDHIVLNYIRPVSERINEIIAAWEKAPAVPIEDISHFRVLSEYNNVVLAARDDSDRSFGYGFEFVTWRYTHGRTALEHGNYTSDYEAAKEDFAVRCGLIDRNKLFDETEMKLIRQGLVHLGADFPDLTYEQNTLLGKVVEKIEMIVPEIEEHEVYEEQALAPEDGLEI